MRQHFKRVVSAVLATALVAQVGVVSAWAAPFKAQGHTFTYYDTKTYPPQPGCIPLPEPRT